MTRAADSAWFRERPKRLRLPAHPRLILTVGAAVLIAAVTHYLERPAAFPVRAVELQGDFSRVDRGALTAAIAPVAHGNFFLLNLREIQARAGTVPWVDHVSVTRHWPLDIRVRFTVQQPVARWADGGWINAHGDKIRLGGRFLPTGLPVLSGPPGSQPRLYAHFQALLPLLAHYRLAASAIVLSARGGWRLSTTGGMTIVMGRTDVRKRLTRFLHLMAPIAATRKGTMKRVDLRYGNGFAVAWASDANSQDRGSQ